MFNSQTRFLFQQMYNHSPFLFSFQPLVQPPVWFYKAINLTVPQNESSNPPVWGAQPDDFIHNKKILCLRIFERLFYAILRSSVRQITETNRRKLTCSAIQRL